jgi:hypothetical protein
MPLIILLPLIIFPFSSLIYQENKSVVPVGVYLYIQIAKLSANAFVRKVQLSFQSAMYIATMRII